MYRQISGLVIAGATLLAQAQDRAPPAEKPVGGNVFEAATPTAAESRQRRPTNLDGTPGIRRLWGDQIKALVAGKTLVMEGPGGTNMQIVARSDGSAQQNWVWDGRPFADTGSWHVDDLNRLCVDFRQQGWKNCRPIASTPQGYYIFGRRLESSDEYWRLSVKD